ncbi:protein of unknown function (plasmid) [Cupriavidus taiwanensis]|uniref:Uncharacterized protein n=1 Tax=Cupriavidus taiwanensis TaxID=164546 RepID=A0A375IR28_9BURK|nr:protein of unknown function [Cupriavidus taiwanensis]
MHQHNAGQRVPSCPKKNRGHRCLRARLHKEAETTEVPRQSSRLRRPEHCINLGRVLAAFLAALRVLLDQKHVALRERSAPARLVFKRHAAGQQVHQLT